MTGSLVAGAATLSTSGTTTFISSAVFGAAAEKEGEDLYEEKVVGVWVVATSGSDKRSESE